MQVVKIFTKWAAGPALNSGGQCNRPGPVIPGGPKPKIKFNVILNLIGIILDLIFKKKGQKPSGSLPLQALSVSVSPSPSTTALPPPLVVARLTQSQS